VLDYLPEIESDLSAFHDIDIDIDDDDWGGLSGPKLFRLVWRLPAYAGAMQAIVLAEEREEKEQQQRSTGGDIDDVIMLTPERMHQAPLMTGLEGLIDYSTSGE
jgi:hypothetical protein